MSKKIGSILEELDSLVPAKDVHLVVEAKATHAISNAIHVLRLIDESFSIEEADDLRKRFLLAIRNDNMRKFETGMKSVKESRSIKGKKL